MSSSDKLLSKSKRILFYLLMILTPLLVLAIIEIGLRLFNYGGNLDLFSLNKQGQIEEYVLNKNFTNRYFFHKGIITPVPLSQTFSVKKSSSTYRIFCLGASTVQGFPYTPNSGFPAYLKYILSSFHENKNIEVVNCGITAIASYSVLDMSREIIENYEPDLLVVYSGHNEFYGVLGQASRLSLFENRTILNTFLKFQKSKLFLLLRNILNFVFGDDIRDQDLEKHNTMMSIMAKNIGIQKGSPIFKKTLKSYRANIEDIVKIAKEHNTNILLCSLVDNLKDFAPFLSSHVQNLSVQDSIFWTGKMNEALQAQKNTQYDKAINLYNEALEMDSLYALTHFQIGRCYFESKNYDVAKKHFIMAKENDLIRFRAPASFNDILHEISISYNIPFADINENLSHISTGNIVGKNYLHEHVHPNQLGYLEIGKTIAKTISKNRLIENSVNLNLIQPDSIYLAMSQLTTLDHEVANYTLYRLSSQWPFNNAHRLDAYSRIGNENTEQLAKSLIDDENGSLIQLHFEYGKELQKQKRFSEALAEYKAALAIQPVKEIYNRIGHAYLAETEIAFKDHQNFDLAYNSYQKSMYFFNEGLKRWPEDKNLNFNLGLLYFMRNDQLTESKKMFKKVLSIDPAHKPTYKQLSEVYMRLNQPDSAIATLEHAILLFPDHAGFYTDLGIIQMEENQLALAKENLNKAIELKNDLKAKYYLHKLNAILRKI